jgi:hypothetical protein
VEITQEAYEQVGTRRGGIADGARGVVPRLCVCAVGRKGGGLLAWQPLWWLCSPCLAGSHPEPHSGCLSFPSTYWLG